MARTYQVADSEVDELLQDVIKRHYKGMSDGVVTFNLLMAYGPVNKDGAKTAPAIISHGHRAAAAVRINSLKERVKGLADETIEIDGDSWKDWSTKRRAAVLDHELYHIEAHTNADGSQKVDDIGRPYLTLKKHDFHFGGFAEIAARHRDDAFEVKAVEEAYKLINGEGGQLEWQWAAPKPNRKLAAS